MITAHSILPENIYNVDEKGFMMGLTTKVKVICRREKKKKRNTRKTHLGKREMITVRETISAGGSVLPPMIIYKGQAHYKGWTHASRKLPPPPYISLTISTLPGFASGSNPSPTSPCSLAFMADPHQIPLGNPAFGRMSALNSPAPSRSGTPLTDYPLAFMAEQLAQARSTLCLNPRDLLDFSAETLANTIPAESTTVTVLSQLVSGLVTISHELTGVTQMLAKISQENVAIREELHDVFSQLANLPPTLDHSPPQALADLQASIRDLSHCVSAPVPGPPQAPAPTYPAHPPFFIPGPGPSRKVQEKARAPPIPTPTTAEDPKYLIPFYDTKLGKAYGDPEKYARLYPHSYEAGEYRRGAYDLASLTPGHLHPHNHPSPSYAQAASGSGSGGQDKKKAGKQPSA